MQKQIYKNNLRLNYTCDGKGDTMIFIHGFLENSDIWLDFTKQLTNEFRIIAVDLPGHGGSELHEKPYTMCKYAESVLHIMNEQNIEKAFLIGHSMGGYAALAFTENYPDRLSGLCLFHSSPFADNEQKKEVRDTLIKNLQSGKKDEICDSHMRQVFAPDNVETFRNIIMKASDNAKQMSPVDIISSIEAMRDRKDRSEILKNCKVPFLYILGLKDVFIPKSILDYIDMPEKNKIFILEQSGHMGMFEEKEKSLEGIRNFYNDMIRV